MATHQLGCVGFLTRVKMLGRNLPAVRQLVDAVGSVFGAAQVAVGQRYRIDFGRARHVEGRRRSHHPRADNE